MSTGESAAHRDTPSTGTVRVVTDPVPISRSIDEVMRSLRGADRVQLGGLFGRWDDAVGEAVAAHVRPVKLDRGVLLVEADDPEIREAITGVYRRFHELIHRLIDASREGEKKSPGLSADATAWAMIGLATVSNIIRELELLRPRQREDMFVATAKHLVNGGSP